ncbi:MAG: hypothetical protein ACRCTZ_13705 [Sarcina sp.]
MQKELRKIYFHDYKYPSNHFYAMGVVFIEKELYFCQLKIVHSKDYQYRKTELIHASSSFYMLRAFSKDAQEIKLNMPYVPQQAKRVMEIATVDHHLKQNGDRQRCIAADFFRMLILENFKEISEILKVEKELWWKEGRFNENLHNPH